MTRPQRSILPVFLMLAIVLAAGSARGANTNGDYAGVPPFVASIVTPNVLIMLDNSGSMGFRAVCNDTINAVPPYGPPLPVATATSNQTGACPTSSHLYPAGTPQGAPFIETVSFGGLLDSMSCYTYDGTNTRFVVTTNKSLINTACGSADWDGNFLNWATYRRHDALKKALIGGQCAVARTANASCPPSGSPALITIKGEDGQLGACCANDSTAPVTKGSGTNNANGRVPTAVQALVSSPALVLHLRGVGSLPTGSFCVGRSDVNPPSTSATTCGIASSPATPANGAFLIHVAVSSETNGVIQDLGDKARFGLLEFRNSGDGGKVLVPIGSNQAVPYDTSTVTTYTTNKAAMVAGIERTLPATGTPLAETLYTGIRYIAQVQQPYTTSSYLYPIAFSSSGGPSFQPSSSQQGSLGPTEQNVLSAGESCPSGYITNACGRDPFFFGSSPSPGWATPSKQVPCCKTFIMFLTDGEPNQDNNIPAALQDYAVNAHGPRCAGTYVGPPASDPTAPQYLAAPGCFNSESSTIAPATLIKKHKVDYPNVSGGTGTLTAPSVNHAVDDVAYWGHITDLRQATIPGINEPGHDLPGFQNVTVYPVFAFGNINGREILMQTAKQGGFEDQNGNNLPDLQSEWDKVDNATGLLVPDGVPDTYFESENADDIRDKLLSALTSIFQKAASGTSVSILASSFTGEGALYQAYFFPTTFYTAGSVITEVKWTGYLQGLFVDKYGNLREDYSGPGCTGPPDGKLILTHDCIVKIRLDTATGNVVVDRYQDTNGDGTGDTFVGTFTLQQVQPVWEAGRQLALTDPGNSCPANTGGVTCRRILTWVDISNGGGVGPSAEEYNEFRADRVSILCPYLGGALVLDCNSSNATNKANALNEATNIINFIRGNQVSGLRDRQLNVVDDQGVPATKVWKLGDIIHSTPVVVGAPHERYDVLYGDAGYAAFYRRYKDRRQVAYVGANDGMLHGFNAGFQTLGDDTSTPSVVEHVRFLSQPVQAGTSTPCSALPCDGNVSQYTLRGGNPKLGAELWAFIPQDLLPQLRWLTSPVYDHVYYVDLKPKVTDARIFAADADHPGGWGTVLIGGFRLGGSCTNCTQGKGGARVVTADFNSNGNTTDMGNGSSGSDTRVFLSSYFVLDVTNPEKDPVLLWVFRDKDLGLTTAEPAVVRVNPIQDSVTSSTNEKWYVVFGTGPTHYDGASSQTAKFFVVDLMLGPSYSLINATSGGSCSLGSPCIQADATASTDQVRVFSTGQAGAFMGDASTLDFNLDFRTDVIYAGTAICTGSSPSPCNGGAPMWKGAMYRLTTNGGNTDPDTWGFFGAPTPLISTFAFTSPQITTCTTASPCKVGPVLAAPALTLDETSRIWVFFGSGRFYANNDKINQDMQHFFGVKDSYMTLGSPPQNTERNNLFNVSNVTICTSCGSSANVSYNGGATYSGGFDAGSNSLISNIQNVDGWFTTLPGARERNLSTAILLGGSLYFTTYLPTSDICASTGEGLLYGLYYLTGTPYKTSGLGDTSVGGNMIAKKSISLGTGLPSQMTVQLGAEGTGQGGAASTAGCRGRVTGFIQTSSGVLDQLCSPTALPFWGRIVSWREL